MKRNLSIKLWQLQLEREKKNSKKNLKNSYYEDRDLRHNTYVVPILQIERVNLKKSAFKTMAFI